MTHQVTAAQRKADIIQITKIPNDNQKTVMYHSIYADRFCAYKALLFTIGKDEVRRFDSGYQLANPVRNDWVFALFSRKTAGFSAACVI